MEQNIDALQERFRVIACDLRGHGLTTHHNDEITAREFYTFPNIADDVSQLLEHLGVGRFSLVGQAYWGVSTAAHIYNRHAERVDAMVFAACDLIASPSGDQEPYAGLGEVTVRNFERMIALARDRGMRAVYEDRLKSETFWGPTVLGSPELLAIFKRLHDETSPVAFTHFPRFHQRTVEELLIKLSKYRTPLMMLLGAEDSHNNQMIFNMSQLYPDTCVTIIPNCGHYPTIENPIDFNRAVTNFVAGAIVTPGHLE
nr:alpha/beta hydrolase [Novosphingobium marinum]